MGTDCLFLLFSQDSNSILTLFSLSLKFNVTISFSLDPTQTPTIFRQCFVIGTFNALSKDPQKLGYLASVLSVWEVDTCQ